MPALRNLSFATSNLFNINEPGLAIYSDTDGWSQDQYDKKVEWTADAIKVLDADVWAFQELWHKKSLTEVFKKAGLNTKYKLIAPTTHRGQRIICAGAVRKDLLVGEPEWIDEFPEKFILQSGGDDAQTSDISVSLTKFSRPVLHFRVKPRPGKAISVYVAHFKSKGPTRIFRERWYRNDNEFYKKHAEGLGAAISTIRRTAEASALRMILTEAMKGNEQPVVVMGDLNDGQGSNTLNIVTGQPNYLLSGLRTGGSDVDLYSAGTLQEYRSRRDVYYTHVFQNNRESLDHILVSQEFYDNSRKRVWAFDGMEILNDHLNAHDHKESGSSDHGFVKASFKYKPVRN